VIDRAGDGIRRGRVFWITVIPVAQQELINNTAPMMPSRAIKALII
jgi:hypothetical protein